MGKLKTGKRKLPSVLRWVLWVLLVQFILVNISAAIYAYKLTHFYNDPSLRNPGKPKNIFSKTWKLFTGPKQPKSIITEHPGSVYQTITLKTRDDLKIEAWYWPVDSLAKGAVILFHGITGSKSMLLDEAGAFRSLGYHVMLVDFRAHGNSEGNTTTIGVKETEEVKLAFDYLLQKGEKKIYLYGSSLGAVVITKAISDYQLATAGVILEMPFLSLQTYLKAKARLLGFPQQPFAFLTTFWIGVEKGFNGYNHQTTRYARKLNCPVLMQCGAKDAFVMKEDANKIFEAIASPHKKLITYPEGQHESFLRHDPLKWRIEMERFLQE